MLIYNSSSSCLFFISLKNECAFYFKQSNSMRYFMNKLKLIASSLLMASMLTTASFSMQAAPDFEVEPGFKPTLTCRYEESQTHKMPEQCASELTALIAEVRASKENQSPKYSWMSGKDRSEFENIMSSAGAIGGRGWINIGQKLKTTQKWLAQCEIQSRYEILYKDITDYQNIIIGSFYISPRPSEFSVLSSGDINEFKSLVKSLPNNVYIEDLSKAQQWWMDVQGQYDDLDALLSGLTRNADYTWMTQEDHAAFADAQTHSTAAGMDSISDMYISNRKVSEKKAAYTNWLANRQQFRTDTIALEHFVAGMSEAEQAAFNEAKVSMAYTPENNISDSYHGTKSPTEKLAIYTQWLTAYRQNQAAIIALDSFSTGVDMTTAEREAFNAAKVSMTYTPENDISDMHNAHKSPTEKLAIYTQWLTAYRQANA